MRSVQAGNHQYFNNVSPVQSLVPWRMISYPEAMSRPAAATIAGILFVFVYIVAIVMIPDLLGRMHWAAEAVYWLVAGLLWVLPVRWLMFWSVGKR